MRKNINPLTNTSPRAFIDQIFQAKAMTNGKSVKRSISCVLKFASEAALVRAAALHGRRVLKINSEYILIDVNDSTQWLDDAQEPPKEGLTGQG